MLSFSIAMLVVLLGLLASWKSIKHLFHQTTITSKISKKTHNSLPKLPPSPPRLPIIGHLHLVGSLPHRSFQRLAKKYGPIMHLKLGSMPVVVVSSPKMAELLLRNHDSLSATRPISQVTHDLSYDSKGIIFTPYGPSWRNARKMCVMELLSSSKTQSFAWLRKEEIVKLVDSIKSSAQANEPVDVGFKVASVLEDLIYRMLYGTHKDENFALKTVVLEALRLAGILNIADYLPFLAPFDLQGLKRRIKKLMKVVDGVLEKIIEKHEDESQKDQRSHKDLVDAMLLLIKNSSIPTKSEPKYAIERDNIKAILIDLVVPAIDSATNIVKWGLSSLLKNPETMKKLQSEIENVVGMHKMVEETDLHKLHYLNLVVKEIFRLYPIIFAPHQTIEDITFDGYYVPKGSNIFLNAWAIGRDPKIWSDDCEEFRPERFLNDDIDIINGRDFRLAPFGFGRRGCPGTQLGLLNVNLLLAQLVHCFDWKMPNGLSPNDIDMQEKFGLVMSMVKNLVVVPIYRLKV